MFYLVYVSMAADDLKEGDLLDILAKSREGNRKHEITGLLLHKDGNFMQALEGEETVVRALYDKIRLDPRHRGVLTLVEGRRDERHYAGWSMGFEDLNTPEVGDLPGYSDLLERPLTAEAFQEDPAECERLLLAFKKGE